MKINKTAIILSGGKSSRMNYQDKAFLNLSGKHFIEIILDNLSNYKEIIVSCNKEKNYSSLSENVRLIKDEVLDKGPMSGMYSCLKNSKYDECLIVANDMPFLSKKLLNYLGNIEFKEQALIPIVNDRKQPLCGIYKKSCIKIIEDFINKEDYKLTNFLKSISTKYIIIDNEREFLNINTVKDYEELK